MDEVRTFIAIDPGDIIRNRLIKLQEKLRPAHADIRWTRPEGLHLTLAFLGNLSMNQIRTLTGKLDFHLKQQSVFNLISSGVGTFGHRNNPRILWAGISESKALQTVQYQTVTAIDDAGIEYSAPPFSPHLTIGRVKSKKRITELLRLIEENQHVRIGQTEVRSIEVIKSTLTPSGAEYSTMHRVELKNNGHKAVC
jgi:2'-5' RNA ligase